MRFNLQPPSKILGIIALVLIMGGAAGSVTHDISITAYSSYALFIITILWAIKLKYRYPYTIIALTVFSIISAINSSPQYLYVILPLLITAGASINTNEIDKSPTIFFGTIITLCLSLTILTINKHGLEPGVVRTVLFRDPNFFALFFLFLAFPLMLGGRPLKSISILLILAIIYLTTSRALVVGAFFLVTSSITLHYGFKNAARFTCILALILSIIYPFVTETIFISEVLNYSTDLNRLIQFNDESNYGRNQQIIDSATYILDKNLYFFGLPEYSLPQKPHNWFWLLAMRFGLIGAIVLFALLFVIVVNLPIRLSIISASAALSSGFLDFLPLISVLYCLVSYYAVAGQFFKTANRRDNTEQY